MIKFDLKKKPSISLLYEDDLIRTRYKLDQKPMFMKAMAKFCPDVLQTIDQKSMPPPEGLPTQKKCAENTEEGSFDYTG